MAVTAPPTRKYNPGFLTDDELVASFCVRTSEFESIVEMLRECTGSSNPHQIVIGPRGSGKTSLLLRVAAEVRRDAGLSSAFFPVVFAEESYEVGTAGEFWLECLSRLADQAPQREDGPDMHLTFEDLRALRDDRTLAERCLGALLDFSDREGRRLVLMVENLNMMFRDMEDSREAGWRLRKTLQTEPRIILLASATSRFDAIDRPDHALYDLFRTLTLRPLDTNECAVLWEAVSGQRHPPETIRSLEILTGGSPRLLAIVARFGAGLSFRELMADLLDLVDDHTEYFKNHLESLPAQERRVYLALADLWKPAFTKEIADRARLETSKCSAQLTRLVERGAVQVAGGTVRRKQYYLSERLYNIYYLLRRHRGPDRLIEALIRFMASYYSPDELKDIGVRIAREADSLGSETRSLHLSAFAQLMELPALAGHREELLATIPEGFSDVFDRSTALPDVTKTTRIGMRPDHPRAGQPGGDMAEFAELSVAAARIGEALRLEDQNRTEEALAVYDEVVRRFGTSENPALLERVATALFFKGITLGTMNRPEEKLAVYDEVVHRFGTSENPALLEPLAKALVNKGVTLGTMNRPKEELAVYDEVVHRFGTSENPALLEPLAKALFFKGVTLGTMNRPEEALAAYDEVVHRFGTSENPALLEPLAKALFFKGVTLGTMNRPEEELAVYDEVVHRFGTSENPALLEPLAKALFFKGITLGTMNRPEEALAVYDEVVHRFGTSENPALLEPLAKALISKGVTLGTMNRPEEDLAVYDEVVHRFGTSENPALLEPLAKALISKGVTLGTMNRPEEALAVYDEVVHRFGTSENPALLERVATALFFKGVTLGTMNRPEEELAVYDEVVHRFGTSENPALLEPLAKALVNKGVTLGTMNRPEEELAVYDEVVHRFGTSENPALLEPLAKALFFKGVTLGTMNRPEEKLAVYDEVVHRFGTSENPALLEPLAKALVNKGVTLGTMNRPEEELAVYDEVVHRFGTSENPALLEPLAKALFFKGVTLGTMNRPKEKLAVYDEVVHRFGTSENPALLEPLAKALVNKGITLGGLKRPEEALAAYDEVVRRFGESESSDCRSWAGLALLERASTELTLRQYGLAIETAGRVLEPRQTESQEGRLRGHLIRATAIFASGDQSACEQDIEAILAILPEIGSLPKESLNALVFFSAAFGPERICELIKASPSAILLLPLTTALEWELGLQPRVAREVEEVALDIRRDLAKAREAVAAGSFGETAAEPERQNG